MTADDNDHFLARWSRRKDEVTRTEQEPGKGQESGKGQNAGKETGHRYESGETGQAAQTAAEAEPFDFDLLPRLEDITGDTDVTLFMNKAVPHEMRNDALRRVWHLNAAIRDYVDPAMEYAWDWNTPGMSPGEELEAGYDAAKQIAGMFSTQANDTLVEDGDTEAVAGQIEVVEADQFARGENAATHKDALPVNVAPSLPQNPVRLEIGTQQSPRELAEISTRDATEGEMPGGATPRPLSAEAALQHGKRRHGGATPV